MGRVCALLFIATLLRHVDASSPVQKVVELLDECKAKVEKDLAAETAAMEEYTSFCDDELKDKGYAIETAGRSIEDLTATGEDATATIAEKADEISTLGSTYAVKSKELMDATKVRDSAHADFTATEAELVKSVDQLGRAAGLLKKGGSFAQIRGRKQKLSNVLNALKSIVEAEWVDSRHKKQLRSFLQAAKNQQDSDDDDLSAALLQQTQPQAKMVAYESSSGGILATVEEMEGKAEDTLADVRKEEMSAQQSFASIKQGLEQELAHTEEKLSAAKRTKAASEQLLGETKGKLSETSKAKAADEDYAGTLKMECQTKAAEWEARQKSAAGELAAIQKAKDILVGGVKAFVQVSTKTRRRNEEQTADEESDADAERRDHVVDKLKALSQEHKSYQLAQIANMAASDPFVKIRGLIEDMIAKLLKEAQEAATREAFCQEEMGKSKASQDEKTATADKLTARIDKAETSIAQLTQDIKSLQEEIAQIDKAQGEATSMRNKENEEYKKASSDFKQSAEAVAKAIEVLKTYYEGAFIQVAQTTQAGPELGGAKSDTASTIISVLEMSEEDFTTLLAETEETESAAAKAFDKLTQENAVAKASKSTEVKAKTSEIKSLKVSLSHHQEDFDSVTAELDAVNAYIAKLQPECQDKALSYAEKKAAREAEIDGLKEALGILQGDLALAQTGQKLRAVRQN